MPSTARVLVAMSGGVDSATAAWLLKKKGLEVVGFTLNLLPGDSAENPHGGTSNTTTAEIRTARRICRFLGITHRVIDCVYAFREKVIQPFCHEYP